MSEYTHLADEKTISKRGSKMPGVNQLGRGWAGAPGMSVDCSVAALWSGGMRAGREKIEETQGALLM